MAKVEPFEAEDVDTEQSTRRLFSTFDMSPHAVHLRRLQL